MSEKEITKVSDTNHSTVCRRLFSPKVPYSAEVAAYLGIDRAQIIADPKQLSIIAATGPFMESRYCSSEILIDRYLRDYVKRRPLLQPTVVEFAVGFNLHSRTIGKEYPYVQYVATDEHAESLKKRVLLEEKLGLQLANVSTMRLDAVNGDGFADVIGTVRAGQRGVLFVEGFWRYIDFEQKKKHLAIANNLLRHMGESVYITPDAITLDEYQELMVLQNIGKEMNAAYSQTLNINFETNMFTDENHRESFLRSCGLQLKEVHAQGDLVPTLSCYGELQRLVPLSSEKWDHIKSTIAKRKLFVLELVK